MLKISRLILIALLFTFVGLSGCASDEDEPAELEVIDQSPVPDPVPNPEPDPLPEPDPVPEPDPTPAPDPIPDPVPEPDPVPDPSVDTDGDGVYDADDPYPNDVFRSALPPEEFDLGIVYSRELYVSPNGSNSGGDGSIGNPYQTVAHAAARATPGTRINLLAGTYPVDGYIANLQGTANEPVAIVASGNVIFDGGGAAQVPLRFTDPRYLVLEGFTIQNSEIHGINIDDGGSYDSPAEHIIIRNLTFRNIGTGGNHDCLKMSGVDNFIVTGSEFDDCDRGEAIDMVGCHQGIIKGNFFRNMPINAMNTKGGSSDILIEANHFSDISSRAINAGGSTGLPYFRPIDAPYEGARIRILSNIFERVGINSGASVAFTGCDHCVFANNTIIEPRSYISRILQESQDARFVPSRYGYFINNIIVFNQADIRSYVNVGAATAPDTFIFGNNLWYAMDDPGFTGPSYYGGIPPESNSVIQQDPQLDLVGGDYRITVNSPAAGNGRDVPGGITADYDGFSVNNPFDIGAFRARP